MLVEKSISVPGSTMTLMPEHVMPGPVSLAIHMVLSGYGLIGVTDGGQGDKITLPGPMSLGHAAQQIRGSRDKLLASKSRFRP